MNQITASIVINTYNRSSYLARLLRSLSRQRNALFEVIIVNGPSTDATADVLADYRDRIKQAQCPDRNLSRSRNIGIAAASGDIVVFIDDDAIPTDDLWLSRYLLLFAEDARQHIGAAGGPVLFQNSESYEFSNGLTSTTGFHIFDTEDEGDETEREAGVWFQGVRGCNCAFRREALLAIGGFDEAYTYYLDESDVCARMIDRGYAVAHVPAAVVRHFSAPSQNRSSILRRNYRTIARSDTYYTIKNASGPTARRVGAALLLSTRKHFFRELLRAAGASWATWGLAAKALAQWAAGLCAGVAIGVRPRQLGTFGLPAPLRAFPTITTGKALTIALLTQAVPGQKGYGGIARYTYDLARGLHERGHTIHIICRHEQPVIYEAQGFTIHGISEAQAAPQGIVPNSPILDKNLSYSMAVLDKLIALRDAGTPVDVVHATNWDIEALSVIRSGLVPVTLMLVSPLAQVVQTEHWPLSHDIQLSIAFDRWHITQAATICIPSQGVLKSYEQLMQIVPSDLHKLHHVALGIVPQHQDAIQIAKTRNRILFVGRCERRKGIHILLSALTILLGQFPTWECHIVGDDSITFENGLTVKQDFLQTHAGAPWLNRVTFHGNVSEEALQTHYRSCDIFVAPSLYESFGLIYHEAMQYGKPVIGCNVGGVPETVENNIEGLLIEPGDSDALIHALSRLMSDPAIRARMGAKGAQRVQNTQNYKTMAAQMESIYYQNVQ